MRLSGYDMLPVNDFEIISTIYRRWGISTPNWNRKFFERVDRCLLSTLGCGLNEIELLRLADQIRSIHGFQRDEIPFLRRIPPRACGTSPSPDSGVQASEPTPCGLTPGPRRNPFPFGFTRDRCKRKGRCRIHYLLFPVTRSWLVRSVWV